MSIDDMTRGRIACTLVNSNAQADTFRILTIEDIAIGYPVCLDVGGMGDYLAYVLVEVPTHTWSQNMKKQAKMGLEKDDSVLKQERRRFISAVGAALAAAGLTPNLLAASAAGAQPVLVPNGICTRTFTKTTVVKLPSRTATGTRTFTPPSTGGGGGAATETVTTIIGGTLTATLTRSNTGTHTANGTVLTFTVTLPGVTRTVTASYTKTVTCIKTTVPTETSTATVIADTEDRRADYQLQDQDLDDSRSMGRVCYLA